MFYKNILEVIPIYMYGFLSCFSGLVLYDTLLYSTFNLFYTSWPILIYATLDYEFDKKMLVRRPRLYYIGLDNVYFSKWVFWRWAFYALWQGTLIMCLAFYSLENDSPDSDGTQSGVWTSSNLIFAILVIVSNMKILISSYLINGIIIFFVFGSIAFYYLIYWFQSYGSVESNQYGTLPVMMGTS